VDLPKIEPSPEQIPDVERKTSQQRISAWRAGNKLNFTIGDRELMGLQNALQLSSKKTFIGINLKSEKDDGQSEGYAKEHLGSKVQFHQKMKGGAELQTRINLSKGDLELPSPSGYQGQYRQEKHEQLKLKLSTPWSSQGRTQFIAELQRARQNNSYHFKQLRLAAIHREKSSEIAFSIELDHKGDERTDLARLFYNIKNQVLDPNTTVHLGVGGYGLSSRKSPVDATGFVTIDDRETNSTFAFSPYLRFDHQLSKRLAFSLSATQFYESVAIVDTFFDNAQTEQPTNIIKPSLNVEIDGGLRWDIGKYWQSSLSMQWNRFRDHPVSIVSADSGRLTQTPWDKGQQQLWKLQFRSSPSKTLWRLDLSLNYRNASWDKPNLTFTPFVARRTFLFRGEKKINRWTCGFSFLHEGQRMSFPNPERLKDRNTLNLDIKWNPFVATQCGLSTTNSLNQASDWAPGLKDAPLRAKLYLSLDF
jgi:hypothetical protein